MLFSFPAQNIAKWNVLQGRFSEWILSLSKRQQKEC